MFDKQEMSFMEKLGLTMKEDPQRFMIGKDGILFAKCSGCTSWHKVSDMEWGEI